MIRKADSIRKLADLLQTPEAVDELACSFGANFTSVSEEQPWPGVVYKGPRKAGSPGRPKKAPLHPVNLLWWPVLETLAEVKVRLERDTWQMVKQQKLKQTLEDVSFGLKTEQREAISRRISSSCPPIRSEQRKPQILSEWGVWEGKTLPRTSAKRYRRGSSESLQAEVHDLILRSWDLLQPRPIPNLGAHWHRISEK